MTVWSNEVVKPNQKREIGLFLRRQMRNRLEYLSLKGSFPTQISSWNLTIFPLPSWTLTDLMFCIELKYKLLAEETHYFYKLINLIIE